MTRTLPVSMDDDELFPTTRRQKTEVAQQDWPSSLSEIGLALTSIWWSRLAVACRGYIAHFYANEEATLFAFDDAFIYMHGQLVDAEKRQQCFEDLEVLAAIPYDVFVELATGYQVSQEKHPFYITKTAPSMIRLFGAATPATYAKAYKMCIAYNCLHDVLTILIRRWSAQNKERRGIRFAEDPEWQPDSRVVVFEQFYKGNRTWVLLDFDRYVLMCHRPNGIRVIFGDRYVDDRLSKGHLLCAHCGMIEQMPHQFPRCPQCPADQGGRDSQGIAAYCSGECLNSDIEKHATQCHS